jgi:hypothetical protein
MCMMTDKYRSVKSCPSLHGANLLTRSTLRWITLSTASGKEG